MADFIRILKPDDGMEVLYNVNHITKIEVLYGVRSKNPDDFRLHGVSLREGLSSPDAERVYRLYFGSEKVLLPASPDDPVIRVIQNIYNNAIRADDNWDQNPAKPE